MIIEITPLQAFQISNQIRNNIEKSYHEESDITALDYLPKSSTYVIQGREKASNRTLKDILKPLGFTPSLDHSFTLIFLPEGELDISNFYFALDYSCYSTRWELQFKIFNSL